MKGNSLKAIERQINNNGPTYRSLIDLKQGKIIQIKGYSINKIEIEKRTIL